MKDNTLKLSVVTPAYNEEANLSYTLKDIAGYLKGKDYSYEIIVVDDGSHDKTKDIAEASAKQFSSFSLLTNDKNRGKGYSLKKGVLAAKGEYVLFMDADNSTRIDQIDKLLPVLKDGYDAVIASRRIKGAEIDSVQPLTRIVLGNIYIILSRLILGVSVNDYNCGFKLYTKDAAKRLFSKLTRDDWSFDSELIFLTFKYNLKLKEVPVKWEHKSTSKVKPFRDGIKSLFSLIKIKIQDMQGLYG